MVSWGFDSLTALMKLRIIIAVLAVISMAVASQASASTGLMAPASVCDGRSMETIVCLTSYARERVGLPGLTESAALHWSAKQKGSDVGRCGFTHYACKRAFTYWIERAGYLAVPCWRVGENLAYGVGDLGEPRSIFRAWLRSATHRANILGDWTDIGISRSVGTLEGKRSTIWVSHFGKAC